MVKEKLEIGGHRSEKTAILLPKEIPLYTFDVINPDLEITGLISFVITGLFKFTVRKPSIYRQRYPDRQP